MSKEKKNYLTGKLIFADDFCILCGNHYAQPLMHDGNGMCHFETLTCDGWKRIHGQFKKYFDIEGHRVYLHVAGGLYDGDGKGILAFYSDGPRKFWDDDGNEIPIFDLLGASVRKEIGH